jgi:AcrR family transcriptional regulator
MDDLFVDLFNRVAEQYLSRQRELLTAPVPLQALWNISLDHDRGVLTMEFMALANHRKSLRAAIAAFGERSRQIQAEIIARILREKGVDAGKWPPLALAFILESVPRAMVIETVLGQSSGHTDMLALAARVMGEMSGEAPTRA